MPQLNLSVPRATIVVCAVAIALGLVAINSASSQAASLDGQAIEIAAKKKCKVTHRRSKRGKCVRKKCRAGYSLSRRGKCVKIRCRKGYKLNKKRTKCVKAVIVTPVQDRSDTDGDGLPVWREQKFGTNPNRKSILVQINYSSQAVKDSLPCSQFDALVDAFSSAPVSNPDGSTGIEIKMDAGLVCPSRPYFMGGSHIYQPSNPLCPGVSDGMLNGSGLAEDRVNAFHVAAIQPTCAWGGDGGAADSPGIKMVVFTSGIGFAMPFMHELGHNLGLDHGPQTPNRRSVMNGRIYTSNDGAHISETLDFQRYELPALDENNLFEPAGIGLPAQARNQYVNFHCGLGGSHSQWVGESDGWIDWDCQWSGFPFDPLDIDATPVTQDINGDGQLTVLPATPTEWDKLTFNGGGLIVP